jgi:antitoxin component of RelBE/YafQ-DinJ toxin-antitoxin module
MKPKASFCLIVPDFIVMEKVAKEKGLPIDKNEFVHNPAVIKMYEDESRDHLKKPLPVML